MAFGRWVSCQLKIFTFDSDEGRDKCWHSSAHILGQVPEQTYGCKLCIGTCTIGGEEFESVRAGTPVATFDMSRYGLDVPSHNDETAWKQPLHKSQCLLQHQVIGNRGLRGQSKCMPLVTSMVKKPIKGDPHPRIEDSSNTSQSESNLVSRKAESD
ncbi:uncharacterized protein LOC110899217 isoform X3 [Helianthus annuus]|uniref:uncharacterized protein LOC110899217 isoform X3 n=1 Tax=Helianthus annuus TaxID=4232 RepID=UPI001652E6D1|nr:uncharacterized protein LOC110899217 isoform X3 [Helianthus annuus]